MTASTKKSAKDLAFDKERAKYRKQIRELELHIKEKDIKIYSLDSELKQSNAKIEQLEDWINRLLDYTELSEADMKIIINKDKAAAEVLDKFNSLTSIFKNSGIGW